MTLADYLASEAAREDVRRLLSEPRPCVKPGDPVGWRHYGVQAMPYPAPPSVWCGISADWGGSMLPVPEWQAITVYYRPDGDRYIVTDLGEGWRQHRIRTGRVDWTSAVIAACDYNPHIVDSGETATAGDCEKVILNAADLPDAICRVMLASLRVAGVGR